jgi:predicted DNA-binding transcriptional regulator AlpA
MSDNDQSERLVYTDEARRRVGIGRTRFSQLVNDPTRDFPRPVLVGTRHAFVETELVAWLRSQPRVPVKSAKPPDDFFEKQAEKRAKARADAPQQPDSGTEAA